MFSACASSGETDPFIRLTTEDASMRSEHFSDLPAPGLRFMLCKSLDVRLRSKEISSLLIKLRVATR